MRPVYLLDTNVVSLLDPRRRDHSPDFLAWMRRNGAYLSLSVITLTELEVDILKLRREGKDKRATEYEGLRHAIQADFGDRILVLDVATALAMARLADAARPAAIEIKDLIVAATASVHGLTVLTRNLRHFAPTGVRALDPITTLPPDFGR